MNCGASERMVGILLVGDHGDNKFLNRRIEWGLETASAKGRSRDHDYSPKLDALATEMCWTSFALASVKAKCNCERQCGNSMPHLWRNLLESTEQAGRRA